MKSHSFHPRSPIATCHLNLARSLSEFACFIVKIKARNIAAIEMKILSESEYSFDLSKILGYSQLLSHYPCEFSVVVE